MSLTYSDPRDWGFILSQTEGDSTPRVRWRKSLRRSLSSPERVDEDTSPTRSFAPVSLETTDEITGSDEAVDPRYEGLDLIRLRRELSPEDYQVFMDTVGVIEMPLGWTERGKPVYFGLPDDKTD